MDESTKKILDEMIKMMDRILSRTAPEDVSERRDKLFDIAETQLLLSIASNAEAIDRLRQLRAGNGVIIKVLHDFPTIAKLTKLQSMIQEDGEPNE